MGYQKPEYWKQAFVENGRTRSREEAVGRFRDTTGQVRPAGWELGRFPTGQETWPETLRNGANERKDRRRLILGGGFGEPRYMSGAQDAQPSWERGASFGFRCVKLLSNPPAAALATFDMPRSRDFSKEKPVSDEAFRAFKGLYEYDRRDLAVRLEAKEESEDWTMETVSFDAGYPASGSWHTCSCRGTGDRLSRRSSMSRVSRQRSRRPIPLRSSNCMRTPCLGAVARSSIPSSRGRISGAMSWPLPRTLSRPAIGITGSPGRKTCDGRSTSSRESSQLPLFRLLGTPEKDKKHVVYESGHAPPRKDVVRESLAWLDEYLGPVKR